MKANPHKDFNQLYSSAKEIDEKQSLTADERLRELVKHHSMCLFGIAVDLAEADKKYQEAIQIRASLERENERLRVANIKLRKTVKSNLAEIATLQQELIEYSDTKPKTR
jgi:coproporphyrinogen III oxidase-like Fe-S oxidoreductase